MLYLGQSLDGQRPTGPIEVPDAGVAFSRPAHKVLERFTDISSDMARKERTSTPQARALHARCIVSGALCLGLQAHRPMPSLPCEAPAGHTS